MGVVKYETELWAVRHFLRRLSSIKQLPDISTDFSRFMYTRATVVHHEDASRHLHVRRLLVDTGAHGGNYFGRKFLQANRDFLRGMIKDSDTSVFLADGVTELRIDEALELRLIITTYSGKVVTIVGSFCVIDSMCDIILGFNDTVLQAGDMLVEMVQRAVAFARREIQSEQAVQPAPPTAGILPAPPTAKGAKLQSVVRRHHFRPTTIPRDDPLWPATRPSEVRERREEKERPWRVPVPGAHRSLCTTSAAAVAGGAQAVHDWPLSASEPDQDLRRPWTIYDERGKEEDDTPFEGMFGSHVPPKPPAPGLAFMETSVSEALAEYLAEVDKLLLPPPPPPIETATNDGSPAKPPKRGRFAPAMRDVKGFHEFMRDVAVNVFVPNNWLG